tara:strand:- start:7486 stop:7740 length:255 start_codon:yes stop_codon:yes gene_type:complete
MEDETIITNHPLTGDTYVLTGDKYLLTGNTSYSLTSKSFPQYKVNTNKVKTIEDVIQLLKYIDFHFTPRTKEEYEEMKHLLILN